MNDSKQKNTFSFLFKKTIFFSSMLLITFNLYSSNKNVSFDAREDQKKGYIVVFKAKKNINNKVMRISSSHSLDISQQYNELNGFSAQLSSQDKRRLVNDQRIDYIEKDNIAYLAQSSSLWGLDRINQKNLPLDGQKNFVLTGENVNIYILDSGVMIKHPEFGSRAQYGWNLVDNKKESEDCIGHGTHVAGLVAGKTYGIAKKSRIIAIKAFNCKGEAKTSH
jgi:subtilisin family serine protease